MQRYLIAKDRCDCVPKIWPLAFQNSTFPTFAWSSTFACLSMKWSKTIICMRKKHFCTFAVMFKFTSRDFKLSFTTLKNSWIHSLIFKYNLYLLLFCCLQHDWIFHSYLCLKPSPTTFDVALKLGDVMILFVVAMKKLKMVRNMIMHDGGFEESKFSIYLFAQILNS